MYCLVMMLINYCKAYIVRQKSTPNGKKKFNLYHNAKS